MMQADLRALIAGHCDRGFRKVALVIARVLESSDEVTEDDVHREIVLMCDDGALEHQGDVKAMRFGEVRLPAGCAYTPQLRNL